MSSLGNRHAGSVEGQKHPYLRLNFWLKEENQWYESQLVGPKTKERYRKLINDWINKKRNVSNL